MPAGDHPLGHSDSVRYPFRHGVSSTIPLDSVGCRATADQPVRSNTLSFIYGANYLAGAYGIYAASALAGNAVMRSFFGGTLPLAGPTMYRNLTPQWAGTLLGLLEVCLIPIPFVFYRYGRQIRAKSKVIQQLQEDLAKNESRRVKQTQRRAAKAEKQGGVVANANEGGIWDKETGVDTPSQPEKRRGDGNRDVEKDTGVGI